MREGCLKTWGSLKGAAAGKQKGTTKVFQKPVLFPMNSGRHDWTRTNDPHHVKVVL